MSDKSVQLIVQGVVAVLLLVLAGLFTYLNGSIPGEILAALVAALGVVFGFAAVNGANNARKRGK